MPVDVVNSWYAIIGSTTGGLPRVNDANSANPPSSAKIGAPQTPAAMTSRNQGRSDWFSSIARL
jgi:hypothetical protein